MGFKKTTLPKIDLEQFGYEKGNYLIVRPYTVAEQKEKQEFFDNILQGESEDPIEAWNSLVAEIETRIEGGKIVVNGEESDYKQGDIETLEASEVAYIIRYTTGQIEKKD